MTDERYRQLMDNDPLPLTKEELDQGWHFCHERDDLLISPEIQDAINLKEVEDLEE